MLFIFIFIPLFPLFHQPFRQLPEQVGSFSTRWYALSDLFGNHLNIVAYCGARRLYRRLFVPLSKRDVEQHHQREAKRCADGSNVAVRAGLRFRNQLLHDDVDHGACGKREDIRQDRRDECGQQDGRDRTDRLDDAGCGAVQKCPAPGKPARHERRGYNGASGKF